MLDPSQWKEKKACSVAWGGSKIHAGADGLSPSLTCARDTQTGRKRKERVVCLSVTPFLEAFFLSGPTLKTSPISQCHQECQCDQQRLRLSAAVSLPEWIKGVNLRSTPRKCACVRTPIADIEWLESQCKEKKACSDAWGGIKIHGSADGRGPIADTCV